MHVKLLDDLNKNGRLAAILDRKFLTLKRVRSCFSEMTGPIWIKVGMMIMHIGLQVHVIFFSRFKQKWPTGGHIVFIMSMPVSLECNDLFV